MLTRALLCAACALLVSAAPAHATFPGHNGKIVFTHYVDGDDESTADIYTVSPDGRHLRNLTPGSPTGDDFLEGLTAVVAVRVPEPTFESQSKFKLLNPEVEGIVNSAVGDFLTSYLEENPKIAKIIATRADHPRALEVEKIQSLAEQAGPQLGRPQLGRR